MAATQAYRPTVSQYEHNSGATRLRTNRTYAQQSQTTFITTTSSGPISQLQSPQYVNAIGCSSNDGNGSTIGISTITSAQSSNRVSKWATVVISFYQFLISHMTRTLFTNILFFTSNSLFFYTNAQNTIYATAIARIIENASAVSACRNHSQ